MADCVGYSKGGRLLCNNSKTNMIYFKQMLANFRRDLLHLLQTANMPKSSLLWMNPCRIPSSQFFCCLAMPFLYAKARPASAALFGIRILEFKATADQFIGIIQFQTVEVQHTLGIHHALNAGILIDRVIFGDRVLFFRNVLLQLMSMSVSETSSSSQISYFNHTSTNAHMNSLTMT